MEGGIPALLDLVRDTFTWLPTSVFAVGAGAFLLTALLTAFGVPGTIVPVSFTAGALLGVEAAAVAVAAGGMVGSQLLFLITRRLLQHRTQQRLGTRLLQIEKAVGSGGAWYVLSLRIVGVPGAILTSACALLPMDHGRFALTSFFGLLPAAAVAASVGAAL